MTIANDMPSMTSFYRDVLALTLRKDERGWKEFRCQRLCDRPSQWHFPVGKRSPKIGFCAEDVAAARQALAARSAKLGKVMSGSGLIRCEGKDPDGNPFSISNRD